MSGYGIETKRKIRINKPSADKSTIVSIYPKSFRSNNVTVFPGNFLIPGGSLEKPGLIVIGAAGYFKVDHQANESIEVLVSSTELAKSIVDDYTRGLESASANQGPGIFFLEGDYNSKTIHDAPGFKEKIKEAVKRQDTWYKELVKRADVAWSKAPGNPLVVSDDARRAAEYLNLKDKAWMKDYQTMAMVACKFCGTLKNPEFPVCGNCNQVTDPEKYAKLTQTTEIKPQLAKA